MASARTRSNSSSVVQMQSARSTAASAIAARISGSRSASSGKLRWQCESTYIERFCPGGPLATIASRGERSDRLRRLGGRERRAQRFLDAKAQSSALVVAREAHADALG